MLSSMLSASKSNLAALLFSAAQMLEYMFALIHYLANPAAESRNGRLYVLLLFHLYLFATISVRPIISRHT